MALTTHPLLVLRLNMGGAVPLLPSVPPLACYGVTFGDGCGGGGGGGAYLICRTKLKFTFF